LREIVLKRDKHKCQKCGEFGDEVDHIKAVCLDGDMWDLKNLRILCEACHLVKTRKDMAELKMKRSGTQSLTNFVGWQAEAKRQIRAGAKSQGYELVEGSFKVKNKKRATQLSVG